MNPMTSMLAILVAFRSARAATPLIPTLDVLPRANLSARNDKVTRMNPKAIASTEIGDEERFKWFKWFNSNNVHGTKIVNDVAKLFKGSSYPSHEVVVQAFKSVNSLEDRRDLMGQLVGKVTKKIGLEKFYLYLKGGEGTEFANELERGLYKSFGRVPVESSAKTFLLGKGTTTEEELFHKPLLDAYVSYSRATFSKFEFYVAFSLLLEYDNKLAGMVKNAKKSAKSNRATIDIIEKGLNYPIKEIRNMLEHDYVSKNPSDDAVMRGVIRYAEQYVQRNPSKLNHIEQLKLYYKPERIDELLPASPSKTFFAKIREWIRAKLRWMLRSKNVRDDHKLRRK
ncbi:hypothetical protein CCR75_008131 [Bremia lactucae]|uniref:RxLR effector protein n=1 Tax=Bremia lactucae TaxID=4779 RepID=A0A976FN45_BRELC|nr:hypothetical protein CCR75_008131 [Bremia lactucae]